MVYVGTCTHNYNILLFRRPIPVWGLRVKRIQYIPTFAFTNYSNYCYGSCLKFIENAILWVTTLREKVDLEKNRARKTVKERRKRIRIRVCMYIYI